MTSIGSSSTRGRSTTRTNWLAISSLASGIVGLFLYPYIFGTLAVVLGVLALRQSAKGGTGMAKAGIVLGIVAIVLWLVLLIVLGAHGLSWRVG